MLLNNDEIQLLEHYMDVQRQAHPNFMDCIEACLDNYHTIAACADSDIYNKYFKISQLHFYNQAALSLVAVEHQRSFLKRIFFRKNIIQEILALHKRKSNDYAKIDDPFYNFRGCEVFGVPMWKGILVRMSDKVNRIENLAFGKKRLVKDEKLRDTLIDLAVYSLILASIFKKEQ